MPLTDISNVVEILVGVCLEVCCLNAKVFQRSMPEAVDGGSSQSLTQPLARALTTNHHKTSKRVLYTSLLFSLSQCKGSTLTSEDSSEVAFLLVENYQLTASVGLRIGREYLDTLVLS
jgi:hypothetical protein